MKSIILSFIFVLASPALANIRAVSTDGRTILSDAADNPNVEILKRLLRSGLPVNQADNTGYTALMYAAKNNGNVDAVKELIGAGASLNLKSKDGMTALQIARRWNNNPAVIQEILRGDPTAR